MLPFKTPFEPETLLLETSRLSIRIDTEESYRHVFNTADERTIRAYFGIETDEAYRVQQAKVAGGLSTYRTSTVFFHLIDREHHQVIGNCAFHNWYAVHSRSEIGYEMSSESHKNMGYMSEAIPAIVAFGFEVMKLNRVEAFIHPANNPSRRLVERVGFVQEGHLREHYRHEGVTGDSLVYALLKADYSAGK